eukprot:SAG11_NODE_14845_length_597_cov_8.411647_2_plen_68_part_01
MCTHLNLKIEKISIDVFKKNTEGKNIYIFYAENPTGMTVSPDFFFSYTRITTVILLGDSSEIYHRSDD